MIVNTVSTGRVKSHFVSLFPVFTTLLTSKYKRAEIKLYRRLKHYRIRLLQLKNKRSCTSIGKLPQSTVMNGIVTFLISRNACD